MFKKFSFYDLVGAFVLFALGTMIFPDLNAGAACLLFLFMLGIVYHVRVFIQKRKANRETITPSHRSAADLAGDSELHD